MVAAVTPFSGAWEIDLLTPAQKKENLECGAAGFKLAQNGKKVIGEHWMATPGCGRLNEGGEGTVSGVVHGATATLTVVSGRNGQAVRGRARIAGNAFHWHVLEELKPGQPEGDSGLILHKGVLKRVGR
jgi:hypothetical protein